MTAPYTLNELGTRALRDLGLLGAEETPTSADLSFATETASSVIDTLAAKGIGIWNGAETSVPNEYLSVLSARIGLDLGPAFGVGDIVSAAAAKPGLEMDLRVISAKPQTGEVAEADYF